MNKTLWIAAAVALAGASGACSSSSSEEPQPAATAGDEASPQEATSNTSPAQPSSMATDTAATPGPNASMTGTSAEDSMAATAAQANSGSGMGMPANAMSRPGDEPVAETLRDGQILKIADLAHSGEIEQAKLAQTKASDPQVKKFAAMMVKDHTKAKQQGMQFSKTAKVEQEDSAAANDLQTKAEQTLTRLKATDATSFDSAYMTAQIEQHQAVLDMLNKSLIPSATNPKLKSELEATRTTVQQHLGHAQQIQQTLAKAH